MSDEDFIRRFRTAVCCAVLFAIAMIQQPGRIVSDTKLDLVVSPGEFLQRATTLWDPIGYFGQVQNQAYGYLFPMGPFFWLGQSAQLEPWIVQRLWWALVLVVAFLGFVRVARELSIGVWWAQLVGGFAFALSPRMLTVIGPSSIEVWPMALAPWVLLFLIIGGRRRSPVAMAAASATMVTMVGGVNAVATFAVIPLGALWLLTSPRGPRRRKMLWTWPLFVGVGTIWWLVPLVILGRYSPPFLDFIESVSLTSFSTTLLDALRGTSNWTAYFSDTSVAGRSLVSEPVLLANLAVVLVLGVVGLAHRELPHRRFLLTAVAAGLLLVTLGHTTTHGGIGAPQIQSLLDGALSPLRNTHKFDPVIRLPLVLSLVHLLTVATRRREPIVESTSFRWMAPGFGIAVLGVVAVVGATSPAWSGQLAPRGSFLEVPGYWSDTSDWLAQNASDDRALVLPASAFADYLWGYTNDDVLQPLAESRWGVRNAIPLAPPGNIEMLDAVEREINDGRGTQALQDYLIYSGVTVVVLRNDLKAMADGLDPEIVHQAVRGMPDARRVASFGPTVGGRPSIPTGDSRVFIDQGWQSERPAVEVFRVGDRPLVRAQPAEDVPVVVGAADSHVGLLTSGLITSPSVIYGADLPDEEIPASHVLTDGRRRQEVAFGRVHDNRSASLGAGDDFSADRPVHQYAAPNDSAWSTRPVLMGATRIWASSSQSSVSTPGRIDMSTQPWSAFDGDSTTAWRASANDLGKSSWVRVDLNSPTDLSQLSVTTQGEEVDTREIVVRTDRQSVVVQARGGVPTRIVGLTDDARWVQVSAVSNADALFAVQEISAPTLELARPLALPSVPRPWGAPEAIMLQAGAGFRSGCLEVAGYQRCAAGQDRWGENGQVLDRTFDLSGAANYPISLSVAPIGGATLDRLVQRDRLVTVNATSQVVRGAPATALNAVDGREATTWVAGLDDERPRLELSWVGKQDVSSIVARLSESAAASRPTAATLRFSDGTRRDVEFNTAGLARFPTTSAEGVEIEFTDVNAERSLSSLGEGLQLPVGISELRVPRTTLLPAGIPVGERTFRCGSGPTIEVDGAARRTQIKAAPSAILSGEPLDATVCGGASDVLKLEAGSHRIRIVGTDAFRPVRLALGSPSPQIEPISTTTDQPSSTRRDINVAGSLAGEQLVTVADNSNDGWRAGSDSARSTVVNGWQQGWILDPAASSLSLRFEPDRLFRLSLLIGGLMAMTLVVATSLLARRESSLADDRTTGQARRGRPVLTCTLAVVTILGVGGFVGLGAGAAGYLISRVLRRRLDLAWLAGSLVAVVALTSAVRPWGGSSPWLGSMDWPQVLIAFALGAVVSSGTVRPNLLSREKGISTHA